MGLSNESVKPARDFCCEWGCDGFGPSGVALLGCDAPSEAVSSWFEFSA